MNRNLHSNHNFIQITTEIESNFLSYKAHFICFLIYSGHTTIDDESQNLLFLHLLQLTSVSFQTFTLFFFQSYTVKKFLNNFSVKFIDFSCSFIVIIEIRTIIIENKKSSSFFFNKI
jgi:hypothetical protein